MGKKSKRSGPFAAAKADPESIALMRLVDAEKHAEVETAANRILAKRPRHLLAMKALGFALIGLQRFEEALPLIEFSIQLNPRDPELHNNLGIVLSMLMRWEDSLSAFNDALALQGDDPETLRNLGVAYSRMHRWNDAVPPLLKAIECHPGDFVEAVVVLADVLAAANRVDEAWTCYNELWRNDPEDMAALSSLLGVCLRRCDWQSFQEHLALIRQKTSDFSTGAYANPFSPLAWPGLDRASLKVIAVNYVPSRIPASFLADRKALPAIPPAARVERLKIGYFSADFRNHPVGQLVVKAFESHDRSRFEVFGYSLGIDDASPLRQRLANAFEHFVDLSAAGFSETAKRIQSDGIHILVDLNGWTADGRPESLAMRCAPIQVNWLGYPGTMGHPRLADYLLGDRVVTPLEDAPHYTETLVNLPGSYMPVDTLNLPGTAPSRRDAGLPDTGFVYCSFNNSYKFNPEVFDLWVRILDATPGSVLWLSHPPGEAGDRLRQEIKLRGIDPDRLVLASRVQDLAEHHARIQLADLALDTFPYNSHSTGVDALWCGVPMVSLYGCTFPGRVAASLLKAAGLDELIANSKDEYFRIAVDLFDHPERLQKYKDHLALRGALPLFDTPAFTSGLEQAYLQMWDQFSNGVRRPIVVDVPGNH
ncbi:MAG: tetratricopeptide repeat protein [Rhodocyclaceae bacterium]|nr:tetratricopeptide repeat protein [Rhodocyclaceae bacterium]